MVQRSNRHTFRSRDWISDKMNIINYAGGTETYPTIYRISPNPRKFIL